MLVFRAASAHLDNTSLHFLIPHAFLIVLFKPSRKSQVGVGRHKTHARTREAKAACRLQSFLEPSEPLCFTRPPTAALHSEAIRDMCHSETFVLRFLFTRFRLCVPNFNVPQKWRLSAECVHYGPAHARSIPIRPRRKRMYISARRGAPLAGAPRSYLNTFLKVGCYRAINRRNGRYKNVPHAAGPFFIRVSFNGWAQSWTAEQTLWELKRGH